MPLTHIEYGSLASSEIMNNNFEFLDNRISSVANNLTSAASSIYSNLAGMSATLTQADEEMASDISDLEESLQTLRSDFDSQNNAPDYDKSIGITLPYTVTSDGYAFVRVYTGDSVLGVYVNNKPVLERSSSQYGGVTAQGGCSFRVSTDDIITATGAVQVAYFYPMKGGLNVLQS